MSFGAKDLLSLLDRLPVWVRLKELPTRCDALERRVAALEAKPSLPICEACGVGQVRLARTEAPEGAFAVFGDAGDQIKVYRCDHCGFEIKRPMGA